MVDQSVRRVNQCAARESRERNWPRMPEVFRVWNETRGETWLHSLVPEREPGPREESRGSWWLSESAGASARALARTRIVRSTTMLEYPGGRKWENVDHCDSHEFAGPAGSLRRGAPSAEGREVTLHQNRELPFVQMLSTCNKRNKGIGLNWDRNQPRDTVSRKSERDLLYDGVRGAKVTWNSKGAGQKIWIRVGGEFFLAWPWWLIEKLFYFCKLFWIWLVSFLFSLSMDLVQGLLNFHVEFSYILPNSNAENVHNFRKAWKVITKVTICVAVLCHHGMFFNIAFKVVGKNSPLNLSCIFLLQTMRIIFRAHKFMRIKDFEKLWPPANILISVFKMSPEEDIIYVWDTVSSKRNRTPSEMEALKTKCILWRIDSGIELDP